MLCNRCGHNTDGRDKVCPQCGGALGAVQGPLTPASTIQGVGQMFRGVRQARSRSRAVQVGAALLLLTFALPAVLGLYSALQGGDWGSLIIPGAMFLLALDSAKVDTVLSNIERALKAERATSIVRTGNKVCFRAGMFRLVSRGNPLNEVGHGEIEVLPGLVRYRFSCVQSLVVSAIFPAVTILVTHSVVPFMMMWAWLFGWSYLIGSDRVPRFVQRAIGPA